MASFKDFLTEVELNIGVDPSDPQAAMDKFRQMVRTGKTSPERAIRQRQQNIKTASKELKTNSEDPLAAEKLQIKNLEDKLARMKMVLARKERNIQAAAEDEGPK